ncbi:NOP5/NOP56 family protein [Halosegnis marinus]|uniref:NOP5/NOP56 family protein n=1 Tax=Halosegnis marinus TaxID=3034023 RepID=A0ABD5ZST5_9EURY|nr:NOP5/NOP56 family protein [Halosegnis sp. DT85]
MSDAWFAGLDPDDTESAAARVREGRADAPDDWPGRAVDAGFAGDTDDYYDRLKAATTAAAEAAVREAERAGDRQLIHAVRAMDDCDRTANELAERVGEWAGSLFEGAGTGVEGARAVAERDPDEPTERRVVSLAERVVDLDDEAADLRAYIERTAPEVAPNLSALAGPVLAARLVALAGGLESLAKKPSGTIQVLGAEDALFAHLRGRAPSPKHGVIFTHEYVRGTRPDDRGSAARALAGKLAIAARGDHYTGEYNPEIERQLDERMATIRARAEGEDDE